MVLILQNTNDLSLSNKKEQEVGSEVTEMTVLPSPTPNPQVKARKPYASRRSFDTTYKLKIIAAYDACKNSLERGALLRCEGLYHSGIVY